ncbi:tetratricopeptide repeat protein [Psychrosphaera algicola]|uniref:MSHA biogenesis protein MshN n=1 Tax=Psychrosphaera algicola TaxID=3023714 RepID=A0ABT5FDJ4_9GAMM|nr:tetratricopeptide repeat protein [Psychrosphaera sp. G1-22]MDC2889587.1 hypothetical protein [Psychrosphaera sp. G1-22]
MSVINKMLKDLDQRQSEAPDENQSNINRNYVPVVKSKTNWLLVVMCLILVALVVIGWKLSFSNNESQPASNNYPATGVSQNEQSSLKITALKAPVKSEQLNAQSEVNRVQSSLALDSEQRSKAETELSNQLSNLAQEQELMETKVSNPITSSQAATEQEPAPVKKLASAEAKVVENNRKEQLPETTSVASIRQDSAQASEQSNAVDEPSNINESSFVIERTNVSLTPEQRVEKLLVSAKKSFDKGYISEGITQLEQLLKMSDGHIEARSLLAGAWYGRGESNRAISILNNGLQRYPNIELWRLTAAKIFFKENNAAGALSYLDVQINDASIEFLTMKGSLGRQLQQFDKAEQAYLQLIELQPKKGNWWLGLAIAQDSQGKFEQALESYTTLLQLGGVSKDSMTFAKQRSTELKG